MFKKNWKKAKKLMIQQAVLGRASLRILVRIANSTFLIEVRILESKLIESLWATLTNGIMYWATMKLGEGILTRRASLIL